MDPQSLFRMISRYRLLQTCLRNVSISRRHLCVLSSIQLSTQTPIINLIQQGTKPTFFIVWRTTDGVSFKKVQFAFIHESLQKMFQTYIFYPTHRESSWI
ncbi:hypothetical protein DdX_17020 [Ditylenchus destructor]|uniref:Uncharacterized protein n=1 Tax=Ditylenchus destructor TaxID=166010 RepID=A0AAD4MPQ9_9BILA|nr:hypothetical protein DdX_17020 [Ditylenchus destructor]